MKTHYDVLGVSPSADAEAIKTAYRKALKDNHPDLHNGDHAAEQRSKAIIAAYRLLTNPEARTLYDESLHRKWLQRRRLLLITMLVGVGSASAGSLAVLSLRLAPENAAVSLDSGGVGEPFDLVTQAQIGAAQPTPLTTASIAAEQAPETAVPVLAAEQEPPSVGILWLEAAQSRDLAKVWDFLQQHPGEPHGTAASTWLEHAIAASDAARLEALMGKATGRIARLIESRLAELAEPEDIVAAAMPDAAPAPNTPVNTLEPQAQNSPLPGSEGHSSEPGSHDNALVSATPPSAVVALNAPAGPPQEVPAADPVALGPVAAAEAAPAPPEAVAEPAPPASSTTPPTAPAAAAVVAAVAPGQPLDEARSVDRDDDIGLFDDAIRQDPTSLGERLRRASALATREQLNQALAAYDAAIDVDPAIIPALHGRGLLRQRLGDLENALVDLDQAIRLTFSDAILYRDRGIIWFEKGRQDRAIADFDRAIKLDPTLASAHYYRGQALKAKGDSEGAAASLLEAARLDPSVASVLPAQDGVAQRP